ncbi:hypothetical protein O181_031008 [Austropuccinia psidii MF-1]|uniref:Reverse transcriptase Ty1/copia-type domain-containing protein n=1 Tax=Austropuccinia psidii MF-1 TaxID=1389203 RepID=A0A9Q3CYS4_9BASI|nr:hypothetical protein [Austropuccinia psidii MF-1]
MEKQDVWNAIDKKQGMKTISHCWVFDTKLYEAGNVKQFEACLVACSNRQCPGIDCMQTYAPTPSLGRCLSSAMESMLFGHEQCLPLQPSGQDHPHGTANSFPPIAQRESSTSKESSIQHEAGRSLLVAAFIGCP